MSEFFNEEFNGYEKSNKSLYSNPFITKKTEFFHNNLFSTECNKSPKKLLNNQGEKSQGNLFGETQNINFLRTNETLENKGPLENKDFKQFSNETTKYSLDSIFSKKIQIQQSENNEILYSGYFGKKTDGNKINGNFKNEEITKQVNPFENIENEKENKNDNNFNNDLNNNFESFAYENNSIKQNFDQNFTQNLNFSSQNSQNNSSQRDLIFSGNSNKFNNTMNNFNTFKHFEIPERISKEEINNNNKKELNRMVRSVTISSLNDSNGFGNNSLNKKKSKFLINLKFFILFYLF